MYHILEILELLEAIFAFLSRKDIYRSCARVNHQWNAVSKLIIQKKKEKLSLLVFPAFVIILFFTYMTIVLIIEKLLTNILTISKYVSYGVLSFLIF